MMSSYKSQDLFGSGPHRFVAQGRSLRLAEHEAAGADGAAIASLGRTARRIEQTGTLLADDLAGLQNQIDAIESAMDGQVGELVGDAGRAWRDVMLIAFSPGEMHRIGPRLAVDYRANYVQVRK